MIYASTSNGRIEASPGLRALCLGCGGKVISKCGSINIWHWSHKAKDSNCPGADGKTEWHINWQNRFPAKHREIWIRSTDRLKIADIQLPDETVIEFQHSPITPKEIHIREDHHKKMIWVFDCIDVYQSKRLGYSILDKKSGLVLFYWNYPKKSIRYCDSPVFLDTGEFLIHVRYNTRFGDGCIVSYRDFIDNQKIPKYVDKLMVDYDATQTYIETKMYEPPIFKATDGKQYANRATSYP